MAKLNVLEDDIGSLIRKIGIPASTGFIFITLFNVTDTLFASMVSTNAVAGLTLSFPLFFIIIAISGGFGSGLTALISNAIGEKDISKGLKTAYDALKIFILISIVISVVVIALLPQIFNILNAELEVAKYGIAYTRIIFFGAVFFILNSLGRAILESEGNTKAYRNFLIFGFILNIPLDYIFIAVLDLGTAGVAYATVIIQAFGTVYLSYKALNSQIMKCCLKDAIKLEEKFYKNILEQGVPASLNMMSIALGVFIINFFVNRYGGSSAVAAYGIALRIEQITLLPTIGINIAVLAMTGQNYGAKNLERVFEIYKTALKYGFYLMIVAVILIFPFAAIWMRIFNEETEVVRIGSEYLRIDILAFYTYVFIGTTISILQGMKKPILGLILGLYRQIIMPPIVFYLLVDRFGFGLKGIWYGIFIINWSALIIALIYTKIILRDIKKETKKNLEAKESIEIEITE